MEGLTITDVRVRPYEKEDERLKAFATITFNNCFVVCDLKVINGPKGLFVAMPSRKRKDGTFRDVAHPLNQGCRDQIEQRVLSEYREMEAKGFPESEVDREDSPKTSPESRRSGHGKEDLLEDELE